MNPKSLLKKFVFITFITIFIGVILISLLVYGYSKLNIDSNSPILPIISNNESNKDSSKSNLKSSNNIADFFSKVPDKTNFVIFGLDESKTRTDSIMVCSFDKNTGTVSVISVPRDTYVVLPEDRRKILDDNDIWYPSTGEMKINTVYHYAGPEYGISFAIQQLEEMLDISIPYYATFDLNGFVYFIDEIGGVEFDVPQRMYYQDPAQNLSIDLQKGVQTLTGAECEGLLRYRKQDRNNPKSSGYPRGDLQRVEVQQAFATALINKLLSSDDLLNKGSAIFTTLSKYVDTNVTAADVAKYAKYSSKISASNINTYTIPNNSGEIYVEIDEEKTKELVNEIFYSSSNEDDTNFIESKDKTIKVLNGGYTSRKAASISKYLSEKGYNVQDIGDFKGTKENDTRIYVKEDGLGKDLRKEFPKSNIIVDNTLYPDFDIVIVIGINEKVGE